MQSNGINLNVSLFGCLTILASVLISSVSWDVFYYKFDAPKWIVFDLFICTTLTYAFIQRVDIEISRIGWLCIGLLLLMLVSLTYAVNPYEGVVFILRYLGSVLLGYLLFKHIWHRYGVKLLFDIVIYSSVVFSLFYIESRINDYDLVHVTAFSTFGFKNNLGQVLNIWLPVLIAAILYQGKLNARSVIGFLSFIICICALLESGTRGTILGLLLGEAVLFLLVFGKLKGKALIYLTITVSLIAGSIAYSQVDSYLGGRLNAKLQSIKDLNTGREALFVNTFDMLLNKPFGVGVNNFEYIHPKFAKLGTDEASPMAGENRILRTPHNIALKFLSETGWLGGLIFSSILALLLFKSMVNAYKGNQTDRWLLVAVVSTVFHSMFTALFLTPASLFFAILLLSFVLYRNKELIEENTTGMKVLRFGYLAVLLVLYLGVFTSNHLANYYAHHGYVSANQLYMQRSLTLNPYDSKALYDYYMLQRYFYKDHEEALNAIEKFLPLYPYHTSGLLAAAELMIMQQNYAGALERLDFLLTFYPELARAHELRADAQKKLEQPSFLE
ncbi:O-antigen ligase family protein [Pseudoalteromonas sp. DL2-H2.2]|uniref:O-antigen ligase family protein n=1 Tax=Pseudoalteromonas sp. DL2-H2.2 TaxID=2908889 RepID=UPI001F460C80|nr:O-antigen ligase family protein [Pseudoalteromonas sp. DL2-H2.2]MCF2909501.1 O-antigen ligase family protein [Pseudoalteromonas sp. DL2-H2.2]